ncbi:MAG TPA: outer membrane beta-barrel protein [Afifellaceae bacterium]|nr:outer membrane beta-barrel protein [Afifellaceae bacterium]
MALATGLGAPPAVAEPYLRAGVGADWSEDARFRDRNCGATQPPALFGCGLGQDGRPLGAYGDFGVSPSLEAGIGYRLLPALRGEAQLIYHPDFDYSGTANFLGVTGPQPVTAELETLSALLAGYLDLARLGVPSVGPVEPYIGGGIGLSRHSISSVIYRFPELGANAATIVRGGTNTSFSFMLTGGAALPLSDRVTLDVGYRYLDLGKVRTEAGPARIVRRTFDRTLDIAGTETSLTSHGISASLRVGF